MSDLISREETRKAFARINDLRTLSLGKVGEVLDSLPSADAVEVVRCKDCKYWNNNTEFCNIWSHANFIAQRTLADGYCSRGERKGGDDE